MADKKTLEDKLAVIVNSFSNLEASSMNKRCVIRLNRILKEVAHEFKGYVTHWDFRISASENFFDNMTPILKKWSKKAVFKDPGVLRIIALSVISLHLDVERKRQFERWDLFLRRSVSDTSPHHISYSESIAGNLMASLGCFEDALLLYQQAIGTGGSYPAVSYAKKAIRKLMAKYRKREPGQPLQHLEDVQNDEIEKIVESASRGTRHNLYTLADGTEMWIHWEDHIKSAHKKLGQMGYKELQRHHLLERAYKDTISALLDKHKYEIYYQGKHANRKPEEVFGWAQELAQLYKLIGDEKNFLTWELVYLTAKRINLEASIARHPKSLQRAEQQGLYWLGKEHEFCAKDLVEIQEAKTRIAEMEAKLSV